MALSQRTLSGKLREFTAIFKKFIGTKIGTEGERDELFDDVWAFSQHVMGTRNWSYKIYEDFFNGNDAQKAYFRKFTDEEDPDYEQRVDKSVVINKSRPIALKGAQSMFGVSSPVRRMEDETANKRMSRVWKYNGIESGFFHYKLALEASRFGYCLVRNEYVNTKTREFVVGLHGENVDHDVKYSIKEPYLTIPVGRSGRNDELGAVITLILESQLNTISIPTGRDSMPNIVAIEYMDDTVWRRWKIKDFKKDQKATALSVDIEFGNMVNKNPYGDISIPFTIYINPGSSAFDLNGHSDIADVVDINLKYNEVMSDNAHVISNNTWPILLVTGMDVPKDYKRGPSDVMATKNSDADGKILTWDGNLEQIENLEVRLAKDMLNVSGYSSVMFGDLENIGQIRNLKGAMVPDILTISTKQLFFKRAEEAHAIATLSMIEWHEGDVYENKDIDITTNTDYIPQDELTAAEAIIIRSKLGLEDIRAIIKNEHPELETEEEIDKYIEGNIELLKKLGVDDKSEKQPSNNPDRKEREQKNTVVDE